jgi:hypothetical protein
MASKCDGRVDEPKVLFSDKDISLVDFPLDYFGRDVPEFFLPECVLIR